MRIGISGAHGTGKTTLAEVVCAGLPGHVLEDEPYHLLEEDGYEFGFPPSVDDYRAMLARSVRCLGTSSPDVVFDRTPVDYLAYLAALGRDPAGEVDAEVLRSVFASLDLLVVTVITPETERTLPGAELPGLRSATNDALLDLVHADPLDAWPDVPVVELDGPLAGRAHVVLAAARHHRA
ncbi:AAA family ATPase [Actinosynnema sp. NPDC020468]|uniref:AAA family ATPase n=1 Tax=Actinosynnema sp. NPDC020468 TaxID=3154488 RepID=UPI0033DC3DCC